MVGPPRCTLIALPRLAAHNTWLAPSYALPIMGKEAAFPSTLVMPPTADAARVFSSSKGMASTSPACGSSPSAVEFVLVCLCFRVCSARATDDTRAMAKGTGSKEWSPYSTGVEWSLVSTTSGSLLCTASLFKEECGAFAAGGMVVSSVASAQS